MFQKFISCDLFEFQNKELYSYVVEFISGETLQERIDREQPNPTFAFNLIKKNLGCILFTFIRKSNYSF